MNCLKSKGNGDYFYRLTRSVALFCLGHVAAALPGSTCRSPPAHAMTFRIFRSSSMRSRSLPIVGLPEEGSCARGDQHIEIHPAPCCRRSSRASPASGWNSRLRSRADASTCLLWHGAAWRDAHRRGAFEWRSRPRRGRALGKRLSCFGRHFLPQHSCAHLACPRSHGPSLSQPRLSVLTCRLPHSAGPQQEGQRSFSQALSVPRPRISNRYSL